MGSELNMQFGINTGLVVLGELGSVRSFEYTALGDAINLAARMEQTAEPGVVQIAEDTYRLVAPLFEIEPLGRIEVKGKADAVSASAAFAIPSLIYSRIPTDPMTEAGYLMSPVEDPDGKF